MSGNKSEADRQFRLLQAPLSPLLRERGFKRSNRVYNRTVGDGVVQVIHFYVRQGYSDAPEWSSRHEPQLSVQFGVHVPCMWLVEHPSYPLSTGRRLGMEHCDIRRDLAELMIQSGHPDFPWTVPLAEAVKDVSFRTSLIFNQGFPFLERFDSYDAVVSELQTDPSPVFGSSGRAALVCAVIRTAQGRAEEARELFQRARAKENPPPWNPDLPEVLRPTESDWERTRLRFCEHVDEIQAALDPTFTPAPQVIPKATQAPVERPAPQLDASTRAVVQAELDRMARCGITLNPDFTVDDLADALSKDELQASPWAETLTVLGTEGPGPTFGPLCNRVWLLDTECIENSGDYVAIVARLGLLTEGALPLEQLKDHLDPYGGHHWVQFRFQGRNVRWMAEANGDWLDPQIIVRYDELLQDSGVDMGIYASMEDYGQQALLIGLTTAEYEVFQSHSTVAIRRVREAWGEQPLSSSSDDLYEQLKPDMSWLVERMFDLGQRLVKIGLFPPMGAVLHDVSEIKLVGADPREGDEETDASKVLALIHAGLRHEARELGARAVAVLEDVTITPEGQPPTRAIKVLFEHQCRFTAAHYLPYKKKLFRGYTFGQAFSIPAEPEVRAWDTAEDSP